MVRNLQKTSCIPEGSGSKINLSQLLVKFSHSDQFLWSPDFKMLAPIRLRVCMVWHFNILVCHFICFNILFCYFATVSIVIIWCACATSCLSFLNWYVEEKNNNNNKNVNILCIHKMFVTFFFLSSCLIFITTNIVAVF